MATIAAAAIAAGATLYASKQASKRSKQEQQAAAALGKNSEFASKYGQDFLNRSKEALNPVYDYYSKLGTGDRETLMQYLQPEIQRQTSASKRAYQTSSELAPRSGMGTEATSSIGMNNAAEVARLLNGGRMAGIQGLATLGTNYGSLGMSGLAQGTAGSGQILGYEGDRRRNAMQSGMDAGSSAYEIFKLIQSGYGGRGGGGGGSTNDANFWKNFSTTQGVGNGYYGGFGG